MKKYRIVKSTDHEGKVEFLVECRDPLLAGIWMKELEYAPKFGANGGMIYNRIVSRPTLEDAKAYILSLDPPSPPSPVTEVVWEGK